MRLDARFELVHGYRCLVCDRIEGMQLALEHAEHWLFSPRRGLPFVNLEGPIALVREPALPASLVVLIYQARLEQFDEVSADALAVFEAKRPAPWGTGDAAFDLTSEAQQFLVDSGVDVIDDARPERRCSSRMIVDSLGAVGPIRGRASSSFYSQLRQDWLEKFKAGLEDMRPSTYPILNLFKRMIL
jgi:hypothetical protein